MTTHGRRTPSAGAPELALAHRPRAFVLALGFAFASLFGTQGRACPTPEGSLSLDLTPLLLFALATVAVILDVRTVRRGGPDVFWGRIGLAAVSAAALVGIWAGAEGFFRAGCG